jgi:hypothetical protein
MGYDSSTADAQFRYIIRRSGHYAAEGLPVISVDTKSRDLIGRFHQAGRRRSREPVKVFDHDFPSDADGVAILYGIYDLFRNHGFVSVALHVTHRSFLLIQSVPGGQSSESETITMPINNHLIQIEPSIDAHTWEKRE